MNHRLLKPTLLLALLVGGMWVLALRANAIPVFARKYGFNCSMCHSHFPRLNDFGYRFRQHGYRLPSREDEERTVLESPPPFAMRSSAGLNVEKYKNVAGATDVQQFQVNGLDILSAGLVTQRIGYLMVYVPQINASRGVAGQDATMEMLNVIFSDIGARGLSIRAGRFEPAYVPFSVKRILSVAPYEIYDFSFPGGAPFSETQEGIEINGEASGNVRWMLGWVNGSGTNRTNDVPSDIYVRVSKVFGEGEGQTAGHRVGLVGYLGQARPDPSLAPADRKAITRFGIDASLNFQQWNLGIQWLAGKDPAALWNAAQDMKFWGGFAELMYLPSVDLVGFARYDWVKTSSFYGRDVTRWTIGMRKYFEDNLALHVEYSFRKREPGSSGGAREEENTLTMRLDLGY